MAEVFHNEQNAYTSLQYHCMSHYGAEIVESTCMLDKLACTGTLISLQTPRLTLVTNNELELPENAPKPNNSPNI